MTDLATQIEQAQPGQEDDLLEELWDACSHAWGGHKVRARFRTMLDAEAWLSAVEMLVPAVLRYIAVPDLGRYRDNRETGRVGRRPIRLSERR